eukprot:252874-Rhodomonas_salina.1
MLEALKTGKENLVESMWDDAASLVGGACAVMPAQRSLWRSDLVLCTTHRRDLGTKSCEDGRRRNDGGGERRRERARRKKGGR